MKRKRKKHGNEFKARVALEAIKGVKTVQQIAAEYHLHPTQVSQWKSHVEQGMAGIFGKGRRDALDEKEAEKAREGLERKIGQLVVEVDFLQKKCKELGIEP